MIPVFETDILDNTTLEDQPTNTYKWELDKDRVKEYADGIEAMKQAIYHCIYTERYKHLIYSHNYGVELEDLFGQPIEYCYSEIKRRVTEALLQDERITSVHSFEFSHIRGEVLAKFAVDTKYGEIEIERTVRIG